MSNRLVSVEVRPQTSQDQGGAARPRSDATAGALGLITDFLTRAGELQLRHVRRLRAR
ncbi:hypothetical protein [Nocardia sp. NPDC051570]|uniref:hypothetical protein n=1 Tax=Nocardia sp. NPDC051570 TaxID=3364324 RepID=UPI00379E0826